MSLYEITRSAKVALKCLITVVLVDDDFPYWTSKVEHLVAFTAIFSNICTAHAHKRLFMNFRCKFRHRRSIRRPRFPIRVQNFSFFRGFLHFCMLNVRHISTSGVDWPTDLESIPHASTPTSIIHARFEVDMTIHCRVITFFFCRHVTWPCDLDLWCFDIEHVMHGESRDQPCHQVRRPYAYRFLSYEL